MWKVTEYKSSRQQQELNVMVLVKELAMFSYASNAIEFESNFKTRIKEVKRTNNFSADLLYKLTHRNIYSVEVWKLTVEGDYKYKMFQLDYVKKKEDAK